MARTPLRKIAEQISEEHGQKLSAIRGPSRKATLCRTRFAIYHRAREEGFTLSQIGLFFDRHHTTIMSGIRRAQEAV